MIDINKEAEEYAKTIHKNPIMKTFRDYSKQDFIAGANSKSVEKRIIQAQIDILEQHIEHPNKPGYKKSDILNSIKQLKQKLEDENKNK